MPQRLAHGEPVLRAICIKTHISDRKLYFLQFHCLLATSSVGSFSDAHVKNSCDFIDKVKGMNFRNGRMISFDVNSLFTKVPINDVLEFLNRKLPACNIDLGMPHDVFLELVKLCVSSNAFSFNSEFYVQKIGMGMGSPLSPILSNLYMKYFETELLKDIKHDNMVWFRYVDDVFSFWPDSLNDSFDNFFIQTQ